MSERNLKNKAINIKGKKYVLVSDRVIYFNEQYPNGSIATNYTLDGDTYHFTAVVRPDVEKYQRIFTGHSQATIGDGMVNKTAAMENAETSAVGRALALMGIGVIDSVASADEMNKAAGSTGQRQATEKQVNWILDEVDKKLGGKPNIDPNKWFEENFGRPVDQVPVYQVKDVVDKVRAFSWQEGDLEAEVTEQDLKDLEEGRLPY